jgi:hypothetical protein
MEKMLHFHWPFAYFNLFPQTLAERTAATTAVFGTVSFCCCAAELDKLTCGMAINSEVSCVYVFIIGD